MYERLKDIIFRNEYITYLKYLQIDTNEILSNIKKRLENKNLFSIFENRSYEMLSPNIILENIIFEEVNKYLYTNSYDLDFFKKNVHLLYV